jgi:hypothetical protein
VLPSVQEYFLHRLMGPKMRVHPGQPQTCVKVLGLLFLSILMSSSTCLETMHGINLIVNSDRPPVLSGRTGEPCAPTGSVGSSRPLRARMKLPPIQRHSREVKMDSFRSEDGEVLY